MRKDITIEKLMLGGKKIIIDEKIENNNIPSTCIYLLLKAKCNN